MGCIDSTISHTDLMRQTTATQCDIKRNEVVLEIGFGYGHGLREVLKLLQGGSGRVIGTETSKQKLERVNRQLQDSIDAGMLELALCEPESLTFMHSMFDCIYCVNGFYYWDDIDSVTREIYRVLGPKSLFLTCVHRELTRVDLKEMKDPDVTVLEYVDALKENGFVKIKIQEHRNAQSGFKYQTIHAYTRSKK